MYSIILDLIGFIGSQPFCLWRVPAHACRSYGIMEMRVEIIEMRVEIMEMRVEVMEL